MQIVGGELYCEIFFPDEIFFQFFFHFLFPNALTLKKKNQIIYVY